ncbi:hypothetical protein JCM8115_004402 [Rhodotorula mucilaginosa]|uniref:Nicotinamide n-methyltransferase n=1 Tax=Rhodotorula mucilaginosa TaxID=5537 RepID=A0A9P6W556_RHOMI|nr:nicotinamide n-methyltransferase [Rhodotorula mucilaginosa]TKA54659.1 hypothetical protein B0A53_03066 [Rhodotorula sp. CCFEE 5036]
MARSAASASGSDDEGFGAVFEEPEDFRPPTPPPTVRTYERRALGGVDPLVGDSQVQVGLVSGHPLWGHVLYPAAIALARFLELHADRLLHGSDGKGKGKGKGKAVLELGAGGGLPGLVAALEGAGNVVISDFPDPALVNNIAKNIDLNIASLDSDEVATAVAKGFTWGTPPDTLLEVVNKSSGDGDGDVQERKFDLILLSDLVFNHSQHLALLNTCLSCLSSPASSSSSSYSTSKSATETPRETSMPTRPSKEEGEEESKVDLSDPTTLETPAVLCFFSHHRPWLVDADLQILQLARDKGWRVSKVWEDKQAGPAFPEDGGDLAIRSTVHGWLFTRP